MPSVSYDLALDILFRCFAPGGRALHLVRVYAVDFAICYLDALRNSQDNPKTVVNKLRRTLNNAKNTHGFPPTATITSPGGEYNENKRAWLEDLLNISSVLTGLHDEVQLKLDFGEPCPLVPERAGHGPADTDTSTPLNGEVLDTAELDIW